MSYTIDYSNLEESEKREKASKDIEFYLTKSQHNILTHYFMSYTQYRHFSFGCSMVGIEGAPVAYWWDELKDTMRGMQG